MKIKICGLSRSCDIAYVNKYKPDYIGFVFAESKRKVTAAQALDLRKLLSPDMIPVGVFVNEKTENIISLVNSGVIDMIQLHGDETESYIQKLKSETDKPIIKAVSIIKKGDAQKWEDAYSAADYLLLDNKGGGTGQAFDWGLIGKINKKYFLAGGLNPENVIHVGDSVPDVPPFAVDVSSGVETDGVKDPIKIKEFIRRIRNE